MTTATSLVDGEPRQLGPFSIGPLALGLWRFTDPDVAAGQALLETALACGMNLIDTADVYGLDWGGAGFGTVEEALGRVLAAAPGLRDRLVLATKGGIRPPVPYDSGAEAIRGACEDSLRRLGVDTIDLYQIHRPDLFTHPAEVAETLDALHAEGKIRVVGVSNHTPAQTLALQAHLETPLVSTQPEFSLVHLDPMRDGTFDLCMERGLVPLAWSPLGGGRVVSGDGLRPELVSVLDRLADREDVDRAELAVAFVLCHPARPAAIVGSQRPERLRALIGALDVYLDRADVYELVQASEGVPLP